MSPSEMLESLETINDLPSADDYSDDEWAQILRIRFSYDS